MGHPHLSVRKGKRVLIIFKDGTRLTGKFKEKKGRFVHLEGKSVRAAEIRSMSILKGR